MVFKELSDLKSSFNSAHDKNDDNIDGKDEIHNKQVDCEVLKICLMENFAQGISGSRINAFQMVQGSESSDLNNPKRSVDKDNFNDEGSNGDQKNSKKHVNIFHALKLLFIASR